MRSAHYASAGCAASTSTSAPLGKADAAAALCACLSLSMEAVREVDSLKADRRSLGVDGAEGLEQSVPMTAPQLGSCASLRRA